MHRRLSLLSACTALLAAAPLAAQRAPSTPSTPALRAAVESITEADFRRRLAVIADDSMRGRATPSPELEKTAAYIADAFRSFGLRPGGDDGTFIQRYPIQRSQPDSASALTATGNGVQGRWALGTDLATIEGALPEGFADAPVVLMAGLPANDERPFGDVDVRGAVILQVLPLAAQRQQGRLLGAVAKAAAGGARAWVLLFNLPAQFIAARARDALAPQYEVPGLAGLIPLPLLLMRDSSVADVLRAAGEDLLALRDTALHAVRPLRGVTVSLRGGIRVADRTSAPNVVGILEGSDPQLRGEFVVVSGHMDHVGVAGGGEGCTAQGADSICNGADDDGSGTIGVVEMAQALSQLRPRPRRSIIFLTVSGEERGLWGSGWYVAHPERPLASTVADLHMDMIGRNWRDSIGVVGKEHSTIGAAVDRVNAAHPELGMRLVDDPWHGQFYMQSDHYSFARRGVPAIFLFNGVHPELHTPKDEMGLIDAEKAARIVRMMFYLALDVANTTAAPAWDPAARQRIMQGGQ